MSNLFEVSVCESEKVNLHIKLLESNIVSLKCQISDIAREKSRIKDNKKMIQKLEKSNQTLRIIQGLIQQNIFATTDCDLNVVFRVLPKFRQKCKS